MELGKFEILEELGRGGFGIVYKARDKALNRLVAIKVLHPNLVNDPAFLGRFRQEAQIAANLDHPNLVPVYDYGEDEGRYFIVMGYMPGGSLKDLLKNKGLLSKERALEILQQIGAGLVHAHKRSVIHRDLKPGNILFDDEGKARVSDMGFAKILQSDSSMSMSTSGGLIGTPAYMAPEIWNGQAATSATDIYSLACIVVEMLTGKPLFEGDTTPMVMKKHFEPLNLPDLLPKEWKPAVEIALEKEPGSRFAGVEQFVRKLKRADEIVIDNTSHEQDNYLNTHDLQEEVQNPDQPSPEVGKEHFHSPDPVSEGTQKSNSGIEREKTGVPQNKTPLYLGLGMLVLLAVFLIIRSGEFSAHPQSTVEPEIVQVQETATKKLDLTLTNTKAPTSTAASTATPVLPEDNRNPVSTIYQDAFVDSDPIIDSGYEMLSTNLDPINATVFSPLGNYIGAIGEKGIYVLDAGNLQTRANFGLDRNYTSISWSPDEKYISGATVDGWINIWEVSSGMMENVWQANEYGEIFAISWSPDGLSLASASINDPIKIWDPFDYSNGPGNQKLIVKEPTMWVPCITWSPDGNKIASGSMDGIIRIWNSKTAVQLLEIQGHTDQVRNLVWSPDGQYIFSSSWDYVTSKWDSTTGELVATTKEPGSNFAVRTMSISPDGDMLLLGYEGPAFILRDANTLVELRTFYTDANQNNASWSPKGDKFVLSDVQGALYLIGFDHSETGLIPEDMDSFFSSQITPGTIEVVGNVGESPSCVGESLVMNYEYTDTLSPDTSFTIRVNPKKDLLANVSILSSGDYSLQFLNLQTFSPQKQIFTPDWISSMEFSPDGEYLSYGLDDGTLCLLEVEGFKSVFCKQLYISQRDSGGWGVGGISAIDFSPSSDLILVAGGDPFILLVDLAGEVVTELEVDVSVSDAKFSNNGSVVFASLGTNQNDIISGRGLLVWNLDTGETQEYSYPGQGYNLKVELLLPDSSGDYLLVGGTYGLFLWSIETKEFTSTSPLIDSDIFALASLDDTPFYLVATKERVELLRVDTGSKISTFCMPNYLDVLNNYYAGFNDGAGIKERGFAYDVAFHPTGTKIFIAGGSGTYSWDLSQYESWLMD